MTAALQRGVSVGLVLCLVILSGPVYAKTVRHATHHAHHNAATHATALCSLLCAAGQVLDTASAFIPTELGPASLLLMQPAILPADATPRIPSSRGPPRQIF